MYSGQFAIDYLSSEAVKSDPSASSHWKKYHAHFQFNGKTFFGLQGFGGSSKKLTGLRFLLTKLLQKKFRRFADSYEKFAFIDRLAREITNKQQREYDLDVLRQALTISFLDQKVGESLNHKSTLCVIGDGFASMAALLLASKSAGCIVLINLTKTLLVDLWYLKLWMGADKFESAVDLIVNDEDIPLVLEKRSRFAGEGTQQIIAIQASDHYLMKKFPIDMVINIASMQEMNPQTIASYFDDMRDIAKNKKLLFYCCNREEKILPDGTVTKFRDYPWHLSDEILFEGLCPWHQQYYSTRPPFFRQYDGPIIHKLVALSH
jgi:putative sugar O-methyltransferase